MSIVERSDDALLIFELKIGEILLSDAVIVYHDLETDDFYIPLSDFFDALEFPIDVDNETGIASGWFINEDTQFDLSLTNKIVVIGGRESPLKREGIEKHSDGIYVSLRTLEQWFPITIDVNFSKLAIIVSSLRPLPIENRIERDQSRGTLKAKSPIERAHNFLVKPEAPRFTVPFVDTSLQTSYTNRDDATKSFNTQFSATGRSIVFGQDATYTINDQTGDSESPSVRLTLGRTAFHDEALFAGLSEYAIGDVSTREIPLIADSQAGRGLFFTNVSPFKDFLGGSDTITLRGDLQVGYQVDIKRNGELLDFIEGPDDNGEYIFNDLFVLPGLNVFELVFYGPQGQEIVEERRVFVPHNPVEKGAFEYRVHAIQDSTNLLTDRDNNDADKGELRVTAEASYGLSNTSSARLGVATYSFEGEREHYGLLGLSTSWKGIRLDLNQAVNSEGTGSSARMESSFKGFRWQAMHSFFKDFVSEDNDSSGLAGELEHESSIRISGMLPFLFLKNVPLTLQAERLQNTDGDTQYEWNVRATKNIRNIRVTGELEQTLSSIADTRTDLNFQLSSRLKNVTLRGTAQYEIDPDAALQSVSLTSDIPLDPVTKLRASLSRSGADDPIHSVTLGLNRDYGNVLVGFDTAYNDDNEFTALLSASFGFAYDGLRNKPYFSSKRLSNSSGVFAHVYNDLNADHIIDEGEPLLEDVSFSILGNKKDFVTKRDGTVFIPEMRSFERSTLEIRSSTFPNPFMKSEPRKIDYLMRPSQTHTREYSVILTGEVDGNISIFKKGEKLPASSIMLDILRADGTDLISGTSEFDGFFLVQDVPTGEHIIQPNPEQLDKLGYCPMTSQPIILSPDEPFYTVAEEFLLHPNPHFIEHNLWIVQGRNLLAANAQLIKDAIYQLPEEAVDDIVDLESSDIVAEQDNLENSDPLENDPLEDSDAVTDFPVTEEEINLSTEVAVAPSGPEVLPRYLLPEKDSTDLFRVISGPYTDLQSLQTCAHLTEMGFECLDIIQLQCNDLKALIH